MKSGRGHCPKPLEQVSAYLSKKWTISIIITIGNFGRLRFNDLLGRLAGVTPKILSERLKELVNENVVKKEHFNEIPPRVEYSLTKNGKRLMGSLIPLIKWAKRR